MKTCRECGQIKPVEDFNKDKCKRDGFRSICKVCEAAYRAKNRDRIAVSEAAYKAANHEKVAATHAAYYAKTREKKASRMAIYRAENKEKIAAQQAAWNAANRDKKAALHADWYINNSASVKKYNAAYRAEHPELNRIYKANRRARAKEDQLSTGLVDRLLKLQKGKCACCKKPLGNDYHLDHIMPLALGGSNTDDNMQLLRATCNLQKHAKHPVEFMQKRGFLL